MNINHINGVEKSFSALDVLMDVSLHHVTIALVRQAFGVCLNSLPAMGAHERPLFEKLLWGLVSSMIFVRC